MSPIEPVKTPPETVNLLPVIVSTYVPSAMPVPEMLTLFVVPVQFARTIPLVPLATYATPSEEPSFSL